MRFKETKKAILLPLLLTFSYGSANIGERSVTYTDETRDEIGMRQQSTSSGKKIIDERGQIDDSLMDVVIYNDIFEGKSHHRKTKVSQPIVKGDTKGIILDDPATQLALVGMEQEKAYRLEQEKLKKEQEAKESEAVAYFAGGYCTVNTPVKIIRNSEFTTLNCLLDFGDGEFRDAQVFAGVYPNYKKETLTVLPIYATFNNQNKVSLDGVVLTADKGSLNVADHVENFKIRELVAEYGLAINDVAYRYANAYMSQLISSQTRTTVDYVTVPDPSNPNNQSAVIPVVTNETRPPKIEDYFAISGIELISKLFSIGAKNLLEDNEPLFRIYKGKRVYLEGVISVDNKGMAKKFGRIAEQERSSTLKDNRVWRDEKKDILMRHEVTKHKTVDGTRVLLKTPTTGITQ